MFPSFRANGEVPLSPAVFLRDHLRKAAIGAGVQVPEGHRFGLHNLRHSLSNWMVNKAKVEAKTVQEILRHRRIQTTLDIWTSSRTRIKHEQRKASSLRHYGGLPQWCNSCGLECGLNDLAFKAVNSRFQWWALQDSNLRLPPCEGGTLPLS